MSSPIATPNLKARLAGAVYGHLVGDAMGVPYEFLEPSAIKEVIFGAKGTHSQPPGTWSDDGALMLGLLDSLLEVGFEPQDQAARILAWYRVGTYAPGGLVFDVGNTTIRAVQNISSGVAAIDAGPSDDRTISNGSLMRILPIALVGRDLPTSELVAQSRLASRVTHGHIIPQMVCALYVLTARELLRGESSFRAVPEAHTYLTEVLRAQDDEEALAALERVWNYSGPFHGSGRAEDAFWSAYDAFVSTDSYIECLYAAIGRYGHDTDTTAAIAGGLAGIYFGLNAIPTDWLERLRGGEIVGPLVERLVATAD